MNEREGETNSEQGDPDARITPYELVFGVSAFEPSTFPEILAEAEAVGVDPLVARRFEFLTRTADAVREVVPVDSPPEALEQYRQLLYHAFNFWHFGKRSYVLEASMARYLVEAAPTLEGWPLTSPAPSLYVQLPANLFWGSIDLDSTPEPIDGFFATVTDAEDPIGPDYQRVEVLLVLGLRRDRAGFSVIPFSTEAGPGISAGWCAAAGREDGQDFENVLPGGEISGLYSILTNAEALKLFARALWYIDSFPEDVVPITGTSHHVRFGGPHGEDAEKE